MKKQYKAQKSGLAACTLILTLGSCSGPNVVFTTSSFLGVLDVSGAEAQVPDQASIAYNRKELVYVPQQHGRNASVLGQLDAEHTLVRGSAIREIFATGQAAIVAADAANQNDDGAANNSTIATTALTNAENVLVEMQTPRNSSAVENAQSLATAAAGTINKDARKPLVVTTSSKFGASLDFGRTSGAAPSATLGYKRTNFAYVPPTDDGNNIKPVYADISIHSSGVAGSVENPAPLRGTTHQLTQTTDGSGTRVRSGVRIRQTIATGEAATTLLAGNKRRAKQIVEPADENDG